MHVASCLLFEGDPPGYDELVEHLSELTLVEGTIKAKGDLLGYLNATNDKVGEVCTISSGNLDVVIARGDSFISVNHFKRAGLDIDNYDIIVLETRLFIR